MKPQSNIRTNFLALENLIRTISKGYFADFSEYHPDHTKPDQSNDHSTEREGIDYTNPDEINKEDNRKK
jgi:hypothetical protein